MKDFNYTIFYFFYNSASVYFFLSLPHSLLGGGGGGGGRKREREREREYMCVELHRKGEGGGGGRVVCVGLTDCILLMNTRLRGSLDCV